MREKHERARLGSRPYLQAEELAQIVSMTRRLRDRF